MFLQAQSCCCFSFRIQTCPLVLFIFLLAVLGLLGPPERPEQLPLDFSMMGDSCGVTFFSKLSFPFFSSLCLQV